MIFDEGCKTKTATLQRGRKLQPSINIGGLLISYFAALGAACEGCKGAIALHARGQCAKPYKSVAQTTRRGA